MRKGLVRMDYFIHFDQLNLQTGIKQTWIQSDGIRGYAKWLYYLQTTRNLKQKHLNNFAAPTTVTYQTGCWRVFCYTSISVHYSSRTCVQISLSSQKYSLIWLLSNLNTCTQLTKMASSIPCAFSAVSVRDTATHFSTPCFSVSASFLSLSLGWF